MSGRIRTIKPEVLEDSKAAELTSDAWRLWVSVWTLCDDYGNTRADPRYLAGQVFWALSEGLAKVREGSRELLKADLVLEYEHSGQSYWHVVGWSKHQKVDHPGKPRCPGPDDPESSEKTPILDEPREDLANPSEAPTGASPARARTGPPTPTSDPDQEAPHSGPERRPRGPRPGSTFKLPVDWRPPADLNAALAAKWLVAVQQLERLVPEFVRYWTTGKGQGKRRNAAGWDASWSSWVNRDGESGTIPGGSAPGPTPSSPAGVPAQRSLEGYS